ncbi:mitochondrial metalloendopeptidase OMA1-like [Fagus crenata]
MALFGMLGAAALATISYVRIERIPYSRRLHFLRTENFERKRSEAHWQDFLSRNQENLLPLSDPRSLRVQSIASNIISALKSGLRLKHDFKVNGYLCENRDFGDSMSWDHNHNHNHYTPVQEGFFKPSQKQDKKFIWKPATGHLNKKNWEVYVLDSNKESTERSNESAACLLNGRIVISTRLVDSLKSDAELASVIAHEVGHVVGRHRSEIKMRFWWFLSLKFHPCDDDESVYDEEAQYICKWRGVEADYIGLMLMASAGYDPRVAPEVLKKIGHTDKTSPIPTGSKRAEFLNKSKVMGEALDVYEETNTSKIMRSFDSGSVFNFPKYEPEEPERNC